ncbi:MAG: ferrous iron transport protein A, partial [Ornithinimicrobium sp.]
SGQVVRIGEPAQVEPESLDLLLRSGIVPGADVEVATEGDRIHLRAAGHDPVSLPVGLAAHLFVRV